MSACDSCLTRAQLIGLLAPRIGDETRGSADRKRAVFALSDDDLVAAIAPASRDRYAALLERFVPDEMRQRARASRLEPLCRHDRRYPRLLREPIDAPAAIFVRGGIDRLVELADDTAVAVVGGREASRYALEVARDLGRDLSQCGVTVVSGLARGIDGAAHRGALDGGGRAIAVLGSAADVPYPQQNARLYERVAEAGVVISEMPPGMRARKWSFPARNRIMAGLARVTVVVEAAERSGSLITAEFAMQMGREVAAMPGRVNAANAAGSNNLIQDGAALVSGAEDILDSIFGVGVRRPPRISPAAVDRVARAVLAALDREGSPHAAGVDASEVRAALGRLEVLGLVRRDGLGGYQRTTVRCA